MWNRQIYRDRTQIGGCPGSGGGRTWDKWRITKEATGFLLGGDTNLLNLIVIIVRQLCKYTKNHRAVLILHE